MTYDDRWPEHLRNRMMEHMPPEGQERVGSAMDKWSAAMGRAQDAYGSAMDRVGDRGRGLPFFRPMRRDLLARLRARLGMGDAAPAQGAESTELYKPGNATPGTPQTGGAPAPTTSSAPAAAGQMPGSMAGKMPAAPNLPATAAPQAMQQTQAALIGLGQRLRNRGRV